MISLDAVFVAAGAQGLGVVGAFHPAPGSDDSEVGATLVLLGPDGPGMWEAFSDSPEAGDHTPNPLDRWSARIIDHLAKTLGADAYYPFRGPPWPPFQRWAALGEGAVQSPVRMQATASRGLWASYRGALAFPERLELAAGAPANPCLNCPAPCLTACPVGALGGEGYDVPRCTGHVQSEAGASCREGCLVRRACPAGQSLELPAAQRAFHMKAFLRAQG